MSGARHPGSRACKSNAEHLRFGVVQEGDKETGVESVFLESLVQVFRERGEDYFRKRHGRPCLLVVGMPDIESDWLGPKTVESQVTEKRSGEANPGRRRVIPVVKTNRNAFASRITIGRAKNNDIVIRAAKISKLHAAIVPTGTKDKYELMDMGSANGTRLNDLRLPPREPTPLDNGDRIGLWRYDFEFHLPESILHMIKVLA